MHYLLIHSPLVTELCWEATIPLLKESGATVSCLGLTPQPDLQGSYHNGYLAQISSALANLTVNDQPSNVVVVAHSGAGCWLTAMDPRKVRSYVLLDAIFCQSETSRFDLFDDPRTVNAWRSAAAASAENITADFLRTLDFGIQDPAVADRLAASLNDLPVAIYEETIKPHAGWGRCLNGLYIQWTPAYSDDAQRATAAGLQSVRWTGSHFEMLNNPAKVVASITDHIERTR